MKQNWWKILCVFMLIYVFVFGMLIPLKPAIQSVSKSNAKVGDTLTLTLNGYNTYFKEATDVRVWLKFDTAHVVEGHNIRLLADQEAEVTFVLPKFLPTKVKVMEATIIFDSDVDGSFPYPGAVFVSQDSVNEVLAIYPDKIAALHKTPYMSFPFRNILQETVRNLYFHVPLWFAMMILFGIAAWYSWQYLSKNPNRSKGSASDFKAVDIQKFDRKAVALTNVGVVFGILGLITGAIWANYTWGKPWSFDVKQNMAAICVLIYCAYFVLRGSFDDQEKKARISAAYNIFAFFAMFPLLFIIPRLTDSLHPGNGGNPALGSQDLDNTMRTVFYPAVIAFTMLGYWMAQLWWRTQAIEDEILEV